jgi:hypothetical protein
VSSLIEVVNLPLQEASLTADIHASTLQGEFLPLGDRRNMGTAVTHVRGMERHSLWDVELEKLVIHRGWLK